jgi:uncharacterized protein HemX
MANQTRPHPEMTNGVAWMPVAMQPAPAPATSSGLGLWVAALTGAIGLMFGLMLAMGWQEIQIQSAQRQAAQATAELQAKKQVIKAFCEVAK